MTVVEKIHKLQDELLSLRCYGKTYETKAREEEITAQLETIQRTCPASWEASKR